MKIYERARAVKEKIIIKYNIIYYTKFNEILSKSLLSLSRVYTIEYITIFSTYAYIYIYKIYTLGCNACGSVFDYSASTVFLRQQ